MKTYSLAAAMLIASSTLAFAAEDSSLSEDVKKDQPGVTGAGTTAQPTAKPSDGSLPSKVTKDQPASSQPGVTAQPTAKPPGGSPAQKPEGTSSEGASTGEGTSTGESDASTAAQPDLDKPKEPAQ